MFIKIYELKKDEISKIPSNFLSSSGATLSGANIIPLSGTLPYMENLAPVYSQPTKLNSLSKLPFTSPPICKNCNNMLRFQEIGRGGLCDNCRNKKKSENK